MKNGDLYKIEGMVRTGASVDQILHRFRSVYSEEEIRQFLPRERKVVRKKRTAQAASDE